MPCSSLCTLHTLQAFCNLHAQETPVHCSPFALHMNCIPLHSLQPPCTHCILPAACIPPACTATPCTHCTPSAPFLHALHPPCTLHAPAPPRVLALHRRALPPRGRHHARDPAAPSHPPPPRSARPSPAAGRSRAGRSNAHGPRFGTELFSAPGNARVRGVCAGWMRFPLPERPPAARRPSPLHLSGRRPWRRHAVGRRRGGPPLRRGEVRAGRNGTERCGEEWGVRGFVRADGRAASRGREGSEGTAPRGSISRLWVPEIFVLVLFSFIVCLFCIGKSRRGGGLKERSARPRARSSSVRRAAPLPPASCRILRCAQRPLCGGHAAIRSRLKLPSPMRGDPRTSRGSGAAPRTTCDALREGRWVRGVRRAGLASQVGSALRTVGMAVLGLQREDP